MERLTLECRPEVLRSVKQIGLDIVGELSGFDPCHRSVEFKLPEAPEKRPLVIVVHGGGGKRDAININRAFAELGVATLIFDAYEMNGFATVPRLGNFARQQMLFVVAQEAYFWAQKRDDIDTSRIYLYGISNGASIVANLAAIADPKHVAGVFAEAPTPTGIGYPNTVKVPLLIAFGKLDDLGAPPGKKRWEISDPCRFF